MVDNLAEVYQRLLDANAPIIREPSYAQSLSLWCVTASDPDGNTIQFLNAEYKA